MRLPDWSVMFTMVIGLAMNSPSRAQIPLHNSVPTGFVVITGVTDGNCVVVLETSGSIDMEMNMIMLIDIDPSSSRSFIKVRL